MALKKSEQETSGLLSGFSNLQTPPSSRKREQNSIKIQLSLPPTLKADIDNYAADNAISVNAAIRTLVIRGLKG